MRHALEAIARQQAAGRVAQQVEGLIEHVLGRNRRQRRVREQAGRQRAPRAESGRKTSTCKLNKLPARNHCSAIMTKETPTRKVLRLQGLQARSNLAWNAIHRRKLKNPAELLS